MTVTVPVGCGIVIGHVRMVFHVRPLSMRDFRRGSLPYERDEWRDGSGVGAPCLAKLKRIWGAPPNRAWLGGADRSETHELCTSSRSEGGDRERLPGSRHAGRAAWHSRRG